MRSGFTSHGWPEVLVDEVLATFTEAKSRFYRGDLRPQAVEGGRFSEGVLRLMQFEASGVHDPLSLRTFNAGRAITKLENHTGASESVRFHVPRAVRLIYDVRNNRDTGHLRDGIDPNFQDASLVVSCMDWILAELVRIAHNVTPGEAQDLIADIVTKEVPLIQEIEGKPIVLKSLAHLDHLLVILYWAGQGPITKGQLRDWLPDRVTRNFSRVIASAVKGYLIHVEEDRVYLTPLGIDQVEKKQLIRPL